MRSFLPTSAARSERALSGGLSHPQRTHVPCSSPPIALPVTYLHTPYTPGPSYTHLRRCLTGDTREYSNSEQAARGMRKLGGGGRGGLLPLPGPDVAPLSWAAPWRSHTQFRDPGEGRGLSEAYLPLGSQSQRPKQERAERGLRDEKFGLRMGSASGAPVQNHERALGWPGLLLELRRTLGKAGLKWRSSKCVQGDPHPGSEKQADYVGGGHCGEHRLSLRCQKREAGPGLGNPHRRPRGEVCGIFLKTHVGVSRPYLGAAGTRGCRCAGAQARPGHSDAQALENGPVGLQVGTVTLGQGDRGIREEQKWKRGDQ